ncbi:MAG: periplasmic divalent cation tolerance protein [Archaeoglobi archaeon]|nr:divalent-cation tolerance protein CutA [Candidatus Mnemosynella bozhongmuii]MDI3502684.1 periplasmic divalent cation tolerance protein [Archaeoglobi archaeon]MDK2781811.1 periplasmic divalent cation tolerance protein [Archaeoglobi archaeon]
MEAIVYITSGSREEAERIAEVLVREKLVACVNIFEITSFFEWKGDLEKCREYAMICKTVEERFEEIEKRVRELHSYELPCIIMWRLDRGHEEFMKWIRESCGMG